MCSTYAPPREQSDRENNAVMFGNPTTPEDTYIPRRTRETALSSPSDWYFVSRFSGGKLKKDY